MIDTINPMNFDITKILHGHVRVETRDRWTGRVVDSQEKDNLVTNAVQRALMASAWVQSPNVTGIASVFAPVYSNALGGIICFDGTLTESADNINIPANPKIVAWADQGSDTTSAYGGSFNAEESVFSSNGFTSVWDFLTSQANGTIASLSRTSSRAKGYVPYYSATFSLGYNLSSSVYPTNHYPLGYDKTNKWYYFAMSTNATIDGVGMSTSKIYRIKADFSQIGIQGVLYPASHVETVKTLTSSDGGTTGNLFTYDKYDNNFVYCPSSTTLHVIAIDGTHSTKTLTGSSGAAFAVTENYYWRTDGSTVWRYKKSNTSDAQSYSLSIGNSNYVGLRPCENDIVAAFSRSGASSSPVLIYPDGTTFPIGVYGAPSSQVNIRDVEPFLASTASTSGALNFNPFYLGTIANLDSPVTKTSSQTMKITYTLTEA